MAPFPVLVVHGIWDSSSRVSSLVAALQLRGLGAVHAMDLVPNDGSARIAELGAQVARAAEALAVREGAARIDLVGFSMGALASRWYIQRAGGKARVRRFVSISGPQQGTWVAHLLPSDGARDMRPNSALLADLAADADPFEPVEVHCLFTPFDLMIVPPGSGTLQAARTVRSFRVPLHRFMISDRRVLAHVGDILQAP